MSKKATDLIFDMIVNGADGGGGGGITPSGSLSIVQNGEYDVTEKASAVVNVPNPSTGSINISSNGEYDVTEKASVNAQVQGGVSVLSVPTGYTQKSGDTIAETVYNGYTVGGNAMFEFDTPPSQGDKVAFVGSISEGGVYCVYGTVTGDEVFGMYGVDIEGKSKADVDTMPNATINVNANGTVDVKGRNSAVVNVPEPFLPASGYTMIELDSSGQTPYLRNVSNAVSLYPGSVVDLVVANVSEYTTGQKVCCYGLINASSHTDAMYIAVWGTLERAFTYFRLTIENSAVSRAPIADDLSGQNAVKSKSVDGIGESEVFGFHKVNVTNALYPDPSVYTKQKTIPDITLDLLCTYYYGITNPITLGSGHGLSVGDKVIFSGVAGRNETGGAVNFIIWGRIRSVSSKYVDLYIEGVSKKATGIHSKTLSSNGAYGVDAYEEVTVDVNTQPSYDNVYMIDRTGTYVIDLRSYKYDVVPAVDELKVVLSTNFDGNPANPMDDPQPSQYMRYASKSLNAYTLKPKAGGDGYIIYDIMNDPDLYSADYLYLTVTYNDMI